METILALDPGVTTGYCLGLQRTGESTIHLAVGEQAFTLHEFYDFIGVFIDKSPDHCSVVYEDFQYRNYARMRLDLTPVKMIGIIELWAERYDLVIHTAKQSPTSGKSFYKDDELKRLGVYKVGKQHGRDATRHLLQWANFGAGGQFFEGQDLDYNLVEDENFWYYVGGD